MYRGAVSWVDFVLGKIVDKLGELGLDKNTMIIFHGDHGWNLGDHGMWCKQSNYETTARVPLLMHVPWMSETFGVRTNAMVEMIDMFPTAMDIMNLTDSVKDRTDWDGSSFMKLLQQPNLTAWKNETFSQYPRCGSPKNGFPVDITNPCTKTSKFAAMGYSIRTDESSSVGPWRYTLWFEWDAKRGVPLWDQVKSEELYDHLGDTSPDTDGSFEMTNWAGSAPKKEIQATLKARLLTKMKKAHSLVTGLED